MRPLTYRDLIRLDVVGNLLLSACLSRLAARMLSLVLVLYALERFHSPVLAGWIGFAALAPGLLASPLAGALLDRLGSAIAIAIDMACGALCILALASLSLTGHDSAGSVLVLVALYSLTSPLSLAGVRALLPTLVPQAALERANALDIAIFAVTEVVGPALAGALFGLAGGPITLLAIAGLYAATGVSMLPIARRRLLRAQTGRGTLLADAAGGVAYVLHHTSLRAVALAYIAYQASWGILLIAVPVFVTRLAGHGEQSDMMVGALWSASGVAGGLGALIAGHISIPGHERRTMALGILATALAIYPTCAEFGLPGLAIGLALVGFLAGPVDVGVLTLRQRRTDTAWLGRVMAVSMSLNMAGLPIGSALGGVLVVWSLPGAFAVAALACVVSAIIAGCLVPQAGR